MSLLYLCRGLSVGACLAAVGIAPVVLAAEASQETSATPRLERQSDNSRLTLNAAIERAIAASPRLQAAHENISAAEGAHEQAGYRPNPVLNFEAENIGGTGAYRGLGGSVYTLSVSQELELGGRRQHRQDATGAGVSLARHQQSNAILELVLAVRQAYARTIAAQEKLDLVREHRRTAKELLDEIEKRVEAAREPELQLSKAQIALAKAELRESEHAREVEHTQHVLASFWLEGHGTFSYEAAPFFELSAPPAEAELEARLRSHPAVRYWQLEQQRRQALVQLQQAETTPNPSLAVGVRQFEETGDQALVVAFSMPIPVFNRNRGNLTSARAALAGSASGEKTAQLELTAQGLQALEEMTNAYHRARALNARIIPAAKQAFSLAREGYLAGRFAYLEVLDAQQALFDAQQNHITALEQYQLAKAEVQYITADDVDVSEHARKEPQVNEQ